MVKISQLPGIVAANLSSSDKVPIVDAENSVTDNVTLSQLITYFFNNIPSGTIPNVFFPHVISGGVWSGDSYGSNRNASMTALSVYINNRTIAISAVTARTFTASRDTYIDVLDNLDGTGTLVYTEVANNAASPALASNSIRIGIIVTGAGSIANVGSINQGQVDKVLPIASSIPYAVTDSLGNLICGRDPNRKVLGYRQILSTFNTTTSGSYVDITGLSAPVIVPANRKVKISIFAKFVTINNAPQGWYFSIHEGATLINQTIATVPTANYALPSFAHAVIDPTTGSHTYKATIKQDAANTVGVQAGSTEPASILVELE